MSRNFRFLFASLAVLTIGLFAASFASAADEPANPPARQRGQGRNGGDLTQNEAVQKDLELTDDQKASLKKAVEDFRASMTGLSQEDRRSKMPELTKALTEKTEGILTDKQKARMKEIRLQVRGTSALADKDVAESLKLTDDQVSKIKDLTDAMRKEMEASRGAGAGGDRTAAREKMTALRKETSEKVLAVLTTEQKEQFDKMQGAKIEGLPQGGGFGLGAGAGGRRNRGNPDSTTPKPDAPKTDAPKTDAKPDSK